MRVLVHTNTKNEPFSTEVMRRLEYYGYTVLQYNDTDDEFFMRNAAFVIDKRSPNWRGWRDILSCFSWRHYDKEVILNRQKEIDKQAVCSVSYSQEEDDGCTS